TRAALPLQSVRGETSSLGGVRRAPLSRKPLGDLERQPFTSRVGRSLALTALAAYAVTVGCTSTQARSIPPSTASITTYQVTGTVVAMTEDRIVVDKGGQQWEIARDAAFKVIGDMRIGSKVTTWYRLAGVSAQVLPKEK